MARTHPQRCRNCRNYQTFWFQPRFHVVVRGHGFRATRTTRTFTKLRAKALESSLNSHRARSRSPTSGQEIRGLHCSCIMLFGLLVFLVLFIFTGGLHKAASLYLKPIPRVEMRGKPLARDFAGHTHALCGVSIVPGTPQILSADAGS